MTPSKPSTTKAAIRAALYARISTLNHGQDPKFNCGNYAITAIGADSPLWTHSLTAASAALGNADPHLIS